jgi:virginiamycin A acetyltransferase
MLSVLNSINPIRVYRMKKADRVENRFFPRVNGRLDLGRFTLASAEAEVLCWRWPRSIVVGKYCSIARCTFMPDGNHNPSFASTYPFAELGFNSMAPHNELAKDVPVVGNDVWIGERAVIYSGVTIGDGAVVAGDAVVAKSVPPYAIVAGNPARVVRYRFTDDVVERFLAVKWWDLPDRFVADELAPHLADPVAFLERAEAFEGKMT